jgi:hypothetical protein
MRELLRVRAQLHAEDGFQPRLARRGTDVAGQLRGAKAMKESPVHRSAIERTQRAAVGIRQNGFTAKL